MIPKPTKADRPKKVKKKTPGITYWKKKAWEQFSLYIRTRDALAAGYDGRHANCITCFKMYPSFGAGCLQAGHFIPGRNGFVLFNEEQVNSQCYNCNHTLKGNWPAYFQVMVRRHGLEAVEEMIRTAKTETHFKAHDYEEVFNTYKEKLSTLTA